MKHKPEILRIAEHIIALNNKMTQKEYYTLFFELQDKAQKIIKRFEKIKN